MMDCTMYAATIRSTQEPARPAPQHRPPVTLRDLRDYEADLMDVIADMSEDGVSAARVVMELTAMLRDVRGEMRRLSRAA